MVENESKIWEKHLGKKIGTEKLSIEGFKNQIPFEIYDGYAYCEDYKGHRYEMTYPQLKAIRESEEMATAVINYINEISDKKLENADEIRKFKKNLEHFEYNNTDVINITKEILFG